MECNEIKKIRESLNVKIIKKFKNTLLTYKSMIQWLFFKYLMSNGFVVTFHALIIEIIFAQQISTYDKSMFKEWK